MGLAKLVAESSVNRFVISYAGRMQFSNVSKTNKALCFMLNKGYFEIDTKEDFDSLLATIESYDTVVPVGDMEAVRLVGGNIIYRQRVYYTSLYQVLKLSKEFALGIALDSNFGIKIQNILGVCDYLKYIEVYTEGKEKLIDTYLTNCLTIQLYNVIEQFGLYSNLEESVESILENKKGYMDRAPFLLSTLCKKEKKSSIFLPLNFSDERMYSITVDDRKILNYGFTLSNLKEDMKKGVFK